jgi:hypothetical protein
MEGFSLPLFTKRTHTCQAPIPSGLTSPSSAGLPDLCSTRFPPHRLARSMLQRPARSPLWQPPPHGPNRLQFAGPLGHHSAKPLQYRPARFLLCWAHDPQAHQAPTLQPCRFTTPPDPHMAGLPYCFSDRPLLCKPTGHWPSHCPPQECSKPP